MVYSLFYLAARRNIKFSPKSLHQTKSLLERRLPCQVLSFPRYSQETDEKKKGSTPKPSFSNGQEHINHIIQQAKKGKVSVSDLTTLAQRVIAEGQFKNYTQAPQSVQYIGLAGLVPMLGIPLLTLLSGHANTCCVHAHLALGATILSFLGGSNWFEAISKNELSYEKLGWAVTPQIIGWMSLVMPLPLGMLCTSFGFCLSLVHDVLLTSYPPWMKSLRLVLTAGTLLSFALMLVFYIVL